MIFTNADGESFFGSEKEAESEACDVECADENGVRQDYNFVKSDDGKHYCSDCSRILGLTD